MFILYNENMNDKPTCPCFVPCPSVVHVQSIEMVKQESNAFVIVDPVNTTYYIDGAHRITVIYAGPVYYNGYNYIENPLSLRAQTCYDFANNKAYHYDNTGKYRIINLENQ